MALTLTSSTRVAAGYIWHGHVRHLRLNYKMRRALLTRKNSYKKINKRKKKLITKIVQLINNL